MFESDERTKSQKWFSNSTWLVLLPRVANDRPCKREEKKKEVPGDLCRHFVTPSHTGTLTSESWLSWIANKTEESRVRLKPYATSELTIRKRNSRRGSRGYSTFLRDGVERRLCFRDRCNVAIKRRGTRHDTRQSAKDGSGKGRVKAKVKRS